MYFICIIILLVSFLLVGVIFRFIQKKYLTIDNSFPCFKAIIQLEYVLFQQIFIFTVFYWKVAVCLWLISFPVNVLIFRKKILWDKKIIQTLYTRAVKRVQIKPLKKNISFELQIKKMKFGGYQICSFLANINWLYAQFGGIAFLWISTLLMKLRIVPWDFPAVGKIEEFIYDILVFSGVLVIGYWVGWFGFNIPLKIKGTKKMFYIEYLLFVVVMVAFFVIARAM